MQTKLTLRMERALIEAAKSYAAERGVSVSQLVANYFRALAPSPETEQDEDDWKTQLPPVTRSFLLREPKEQPTEADYHRYLEEKHR